MNSPSDGVEPSAKGSGLFTTTHWSVVLAAGQSESPRAAQALETLCRTYWYALYAYLRRTGHGREDAEDLVQGFFLHLLRREILKSVQREGGRFRSFLLATLKHFLSDEKDKATALKRGGEHQFISWEQDQAEQRFLREPVDIETADRLFDRRWALIFLERAMSRLHEECVAGGNDAQFIQLKGFVSGEKGALSYAEAAERTGLTPSAVKSAIFRLRRRYHELIREEVSQTVADPKEIEEELRYLLGLFSGG
jgi:RNA polymerase sigma factor (sigma-70 family)